MFQIYITTIKVYFITYFKQHKNVRKMLCVLLINTSGDVLWHKHQVISPGIEKSVSKCVVSQCALPVQNLCSQYTDTRTSVLTEMQSQSLSVFFCHLDKNNVRLVGGHSRCAGRVEVLHRGQWGTVCDAGWDLADAAVVCRELDCGEPVDALSDSQFGQGSEPIWMSNVLCAGSESTLKNCWASGWSINVCSQHSNAGVICSGK